MEREGSPYKLEILYASFHKANGVGKSVPGMSFKVSNLESSVRSLESKGLRFIERSGKRDGINCASLLDPNGINVKLFEP